MEAQAQAAALVSGVFVAIAMIMICCLLIMTFHLRQHGNDVEASICVTVVGGHVKCRTADFDCNPADLCRVVVGLSGTVHVLVVNP